MNKLQNQVFNSNKNKILQLQIVKFWNKETLKLFLGKKHFSPYINRYDLEQMDSGLDKFKLDYLYTNA